MTNTYRKALSKLPMKGLDNFFEIIYDKFKELKLEFYVVGAIARDILFYEVFDAEIPLRGTSDVDLAICVKSWHEYDMIIKELIKSGYFEKERDRQRLKYKKNIAVDIVPYGKIANDKKIIEWPPPELSSIMSVSGFKEAYDSAIKLEIKKGKFIKIASLEGLTILKIIAWHDRKSQKDAQDLKTLLTSYFKLYIKEIEKIYDEYSDLIIKVKGDTEKTGIRILGEKVSLVLHDAKDVKSKLIKIIEDELKKDGDNLAQYMVEFRFELEEEYAKNIDRIKDLLEGIKNKQSNYCRTIK